MGPSVTDTVLSATSHTTFIPFKIIERQSQMIIDEIQVVMRVRVCMCVYELGLCARVTEWDHLYIKRFGNHVKSSLS